MLDNTEIIFKENIDYDMYPCDISDIKRKWEKLMVSVVEKWQSDKIHIDKFKI